MTDRTDEADRADQFPDRLSGAIQHLFVIGVFPLHQVADDIEQLLALALRLLLIHPIAQLTLVARVRELPARPEKVLAAMP